MYIDCPKCGERSLKSFWEGWECYKCGYKGSPEQRMMRVSEEEYENIKELLENQLKGLDTGDWDGTQEEFDKLEIAPPANWKEYILKKALYAFDKAGDRGAFEFILKNELGFEGD
jgi:ribosomal protein L37E